MGTEITNLESRINNLEQSISDLRVLIDSKLAENSQTFSQAKKDAEDVVSELKTLLTQAQSTANTVDAKWKSIEQQVQNISTQKSQATSDVSAIQTAKNNAEQMLSTIKTDLANTKNSWENDFQELEKQYDDKLSKLSSDKEKELTTLNEKYIKLFADLDKTYTEEFDKRTKEIERLLPGATGAGLASAFAKRKRGYFIAKIVWGILLGVSIFLIVIFGALLLFPNILSIIGITMNNIPGGENFYGRLVIIAGLILFEEFSRRNFNVSSRLEEAYAYKEALAMSYLGYKQQMQDTTMPYDKQNIMGHSVLTKMLLDKLEDEPGKNVFDKEKHYIGPGAIIDSINP